MDWRTILARDVDWHGLYDGKSHTGTTGIKRIVSPDRGWDQLARKNCAGDWFEFTLGDVANLGRREWLRKPNIGTKGADLIERVIDMAAEGKPVLRGPVGSSPHAYIPKSERTSPYRSVRA